MTLSTPQWNALSIISNREGGLVIRAQQEAGAKSTLGALEDRGLIELVQQAGRMPRWMVTSEGEELLG